MTYTSHLQDPLEAKASETGVEAAVAAAARTAALGIGSVVGSEIVESLLVLSENEARAIPCQTACQTGAEMRWGMWGYEDALDVQVTQPSPQQSHNPLLHSLPPWSTGRFLGFLCMPGLATGC
jgi:hypothetical protein